MRDPERPVTVAALTYRRPAELDRLLPLLVEQAGELSPRAQVLIVDNDPDAGAEAQVAGWADAGVDYVHEPRPGISAARNRAVDEATARGSAAIVFIDDDETPADHWLVRLVDVWDKFDSAAVTGPVRSQFEHEPDDWIIATQVFETRSRPDGALLPSAASNNLLLDLDWLSAHGVRFDPDFGQSGGEDTMLARTIVAIGGEIRWCAGAEVIDMIPADRLTRSWVRHRLVRTSNSWARVVLRIGERQGRGLRSWLWVGARVPFFLARGLATVAVGVLRRRTVDRARGVRDLCQAVGVARAAVGVVTAGYGRSSTASVGASGDPDGEQISGG